MHKTRGEIGIELLLKVVEALIVSFVVGGVILWGTYQRFGEKVDWMVSSINRIEGKVGTLEQKMENNKLLLSTHIAASTGTGGVAEERRDGKH